MSTRLAALTCSLTLLAPAAVPAMAETPAAPLPLTQRVVDGPLSGVAPSGQVRTFTSPAALVGALDSDHPASDRAALRREGFAGAALERFGDGRSVIGTSVVVQTATIAGARALLTRDRRQIVADAGGAAKAAGHTRHLRRIPGSLAFLERFRDGDTPLAFAGVVFADGPFYYTVTLGGPQSRVTGRAVFDGVVRLYATVHGRPPA